MRASFARQGAMRTLGATLETVEPGYCAISLVPRPEIAQQHGYVHAGVIAAIVDSAGGYAGFTLFPRGCVGADRRIQAQPARAGRRRAAGRGGLGRQIRPHAGDHARRSARASRAGRRTLVAIMQQTLMVMHGKSDS